MKLIKQKTYKDCGIACVGMLIHHYFNYEIDLDQIKYQLNLNDEQLSFLDIMDIAKHFKLTGDAFVVENDFEELQNKTPFIAQIINEENILHFVVVEKITNHKVVFLDPSLNAKKTISILSFLSFFQNNVLIFKANKKAFIQDFKVSFHSMKSIINIEALFYIWISLILSVLMILETRIIRFYSASLANEKQQVVFYILFSLIFLFNLICKKLSNIFLYKSYNNKVKRNLNKFIDYCSNFSKPNLYGFYMQIIWLEKFEQLTLLVLVSTIVTDIIALCYIWFISQQIFLIFLIISLFVLFVIFVNNKFEKHRLKETENKWFNYLSNLNNYKNSGQELLISKELVKSCDMKNVPSFETTIDAIEKFLFLIVYYFSWNLIKTKELEFNSFFTILLLKSFNKSFLFNFLQHR